MRLDMLPVAAVQTARRFVHGQLVPNQSVHEVESFMVLEDPIAPAHHTQHRLGIGADIRHRVRYACLNTVIVRVESPDRPLLHPPIQTREADSLGAGGCVLDHNAQPMPCWLTGNKNCRSSRRLVNCVCHKDTSKKDENLNPGWLRPKQAQAIV